MIFTCCIFIPFWKKKNPASSPHSAAVCDEISVDPGHYECDWFWFQTQRIMKHLCAFKPSCNLRTKSCCLVVPSRSALLCAVLQHPLGTTSRPALMLLHQRAPAKPHGKQNKLSKFQVLIFSHSHVHSSIGIACSSYESLHLTLPHSFLL